MEPNVNMDFVYGNNRTSGSVAEVLVANRMDPGAIRPFLDTHGRPCITVWNQKSQKHETKQVANATLPYNTWKLFDQAMLRAARPQLKVVGDIRSENLIYGIPNGMRSTVLLHQKITDAGEATLSMDALRQTNKDRPSMDMEGLPLPIVHSDFSFSLREIEVSKDSGAPLDTTMLEQATRKCVEALERLHLGTLAAYSYAGYSAYGLTNYPYRITKTFMIPTNGAWTPRKFIDQTLDALQAMSNVYFNGPYGVWYGPGWSQYFNNDYTPTYGAGSMMKRMMEISDIKWWHKADYLPTYSVVIAQLTPDVVQTVDGMKLSVVEWDQSGGLEKCFKVLGIQVPRLRRNSDGNTGIVHAVAA
jgi:hypothetical protein